MITFLNTSDDVTPDQVQALVDATQLVEVRVDEVSAGPVATIGGEILARLGRKPPQFLYDEDANALAVRVEHTLECSNESQDPDSTTTIRVAHLLVFNAVHELEVQQSTVFAWIQTNAYFMVYPYVRQFFTTMTADMGMPPVVLGYMHREDWPDFDQDD